MVVPVTEFTLTLFVPDCRTAVLATVASLVPTLVVTTLVVASVVAWKTVLAPLTATPLPAIWIVEPAVVPAPASPSCRVNVPLLVPPLITVLLLAMTPAPMATALTPVAEAPTPIAMAPLPWARAPTLEPLEEPRAIAPSPVALAPLNDPTALPIPMAP